MSQLNILSSPDAGPLEVSVYGPDGASHEFLLSSGVDRHSISVEPGRYAVVARRPSGAKLRRSVDVAGEDAWVSLAAGSSPNEFMWPETQRGSVVLDAAAPAGQPWRSRLGGMAETVLRGALVQAARTFAPAPLGAAFGAVLEAATVVREIQRPVERSLRLWDFANEAWGAASPQGEIAHVSSEFLKLSLPPQSRTRAVGLIDDQGFGPIVNVPPFHSPIEICFLSKSLAVAAADRTRAPGGQRVPVAIVNLVNPAGQDLLSALAAAATPPAEQLWQQSSPNLTDIQQPLDMLFMKFERPAEALLAAHYLLRFLPGELPLSWADNLGRAMPDAVDGPVIAAWARIYNRPAGKSDEALDAEFRGCIEQALARPLTLFARTRTLLFDALRLSGSIAEKRENAHEAYRRFGAEAGGLESFWGGGPAAPGLASDSPGGTLLAKVQLVNGAFDDMPAGPGRSLPLAPAGA